MQGSWAMAFYLILKRWFISWTSRSCIFFLSLPHKYQVPLKWQAPIFCLSAGGFGGNKFGGNRFNGNPFGRPSPFGGPVSQRFAKQVLPSNPNLQGPGGFGVGTFGGPPFSSGSRNPFDGSGFGNPYGGFSSVGPGGEIFPDFSINTPIYIFNFVVPFNTITTLWN